MNNLIRRARRRDPDAFTELMQQQMQNMYKAAKAILRSDEDVADAIQETILCCWEKLGQLREDRYFRTWMTRILINKCNDLLRAKQEFLPQEELPDIAVPNREFENVEWRETLKAIDEKYRLVLMLYYVEGFSCGDISQILDMPESTVRTRLSRGRKMIAGMLQEKGERRKFS